MPQDQRTPREHVVHIKGAVHVFQPRPFAAGDEQRVAADGAEGPHRRVHPTWKQGLGFGEERSGSRRTSHAAPTGVAMLSATAQPEVRRRAVAAWLFLIATNLPPLRP